MLGTHAITVGSTNALRKHSRIKSYVVGYASAYILTEEGVLYGSGNARAGQLGNGTASTRGFIPIASGVVEVKTSSLQTCYLNKSQQLYGFGDNRYGWFGLGDLNNRTTPTLIAENVKFFTVGAYNVWYIDSVDGLYAAGYNSAGYGCLGIGSAVTRYLTFIKVASNAAAVSADEYNSTYLSKTGVLYYAGRNQNGEAGQGTTTPYTTWVQVATGVTDVSCGAACITYLKGTKLYVCGYNLGTSYSAIGLGSGIVGISTPQLLTTNVAKVSAKGQNYIVVLKTDDTLWAVGRGSYGRTTLTNTHTLTQIASDVHDFDTQYASTAYQSNSGVFFATGYNGWSQMSDFMGSFYNSGFVRVPLYDDSENVLDVCVNNVRYTAQYATAAYINKAGDLYMIGYNNSGMFGVGDNNNRTRWTLVMRDVVQVAIGYRHTLIIKKDGSVWGAGSNSSGKLGNGTGTHTNVWVEVKPASDAISQVSAGYSHSCCISYGLQKIWMTGDNTYGQFGNTTNTPSTTWVEVTLPTSYALMCGCGAYHSVVLGANNRTYVTGRNNYGQLGLGLSTGTNVNTFTDATNAGSSMSASGYTTIANTRFAGYNGYGASGLGNTTTPVTTFTATPFDGIVTAGYYNSYGINIGRTAVGAGYSGVFGDGSTGAHVTTPIPLGHKGSNGELVKLAAGDRVLFAVDSDLKLSITTNDVGNEMGLPQDDYPTFRRHMADRTPQDVFGLSEQLGTSYRDGVVYTYNPDVLRLEQVLLGATSVAGADNNTLVAKGNKLFVRGTNSGGQLGTGSTTAVTTFTASGIWTNPIRVKAALNASIVQDVNILKVAGDNASGMFGLGDTTQRNTWTPSGTWSNVVDFAISQRTALVIDGTTVKAAGHNTYNQLGVAGTENKTSWTTTGTWTNPRLVACGPYSSYVVNGNTLYVVGYNGSGQLGIGGDSRTTWTTSGTWTNIQKVVALNTIYATIAQAFVLDGSNLYGAGRGPFGSGHLTATYTTWTLLARDVRDVWVGTAGVVYCDLRGRLFATGADGSKLGFVDNSAVPYWKELVRPLTAGTYTLNVDGMRLTDSSGESLTFNL